MPVSKYIAIDPSGATHKRSSNRGYVAMVVGRRDRKAAMIRALAPNSCDRKNWVYHMDAIANGGPSREIDRLYPSHYPVGSAARAEELARHVKAVDGRSLDKYLDDEQAARVARVEAMDCDSYVDLGWCGRPDLAQKLARKSTMDGWLDVVILQATVLSEVKHTKAVLKRHLDAAVEALQHCTERGLAEPAAHWRLEIARIAGEIEDRFPSKVL